MRVAFLGTGIVGLPMARNIAAAGLEVRAWNRTRERAQPLAESGIEIADDPSAGCLRRRGGRARRRGRGGFRRRSGARKQAPAEQWALVVLASGPPGALERCAPVFHAVGQVTDTPGPVGAGTRMKLVLNGWILGTGRGLAETIALAEALDVDPRRFFDLIEGGPLDSAHGQMKGKMMIERDFPASFPLRHAAKDAALAIAAAERHELALPLLQAVREQLARGVESGHGDEDLAATVQTVGAGGEAKGR
jgi:3-hydroxyisobutyrate dehydrogenase